MKKKTISIAVISLALISLFLPNSLSAAIIRTGGEISTQKEEKFIENTYLISTKNTIDSTFEKDIFLTGGQNYFNGNSVDDLFVIGGKNEIGGEIKGDLRIIGGEVILKGKVQGDLLIFGGQITILPQAEIQGQSIFVGGKIFQNAVLNKNSKIYGAVVNINSEINQPVEITAQKINLEDQAKISNTFTYYSPNQFVKSDGAVITGQVNYNQIATLKESGLVKKTLINLLNFWILLKFITTLIIAFILVFVFRYFSQKVTEKALNSFSKSILIGFLTAIALPIIIIVLMVSLVGLPIGLLILFLYFILIPFSVAMSCIIAGSLIRKFFLKQDSVKVDFHSATVGVIVLTFISFVPVIGELTKFVFDLLALGAIVRQIKINLFN